MQTGRICNLLQLHSGSWFPVAGSAGAYSGNPTGGQYWTSSSAGAASYAAAPYQQTAFYQQSDLVSTSDVSQPAFYSTSPTFASQQQTQTFAEAGAYQPDGSYEQADMYQQVDTYQQMDASGQMQDYQQVDTYASDTTYDPNGNIVDQSTFAAESDTYSQTGVDVINDQGYAGTTYDDTGGTSVAYDTYDAGDGDSGGDCDDGNQDCFDMGDDCVPDLSLDFIPEGRRNHATASQGVRNVKTVVKVVGLAARIAEIASNFC